MLDRDSRAVMEQLEHRGFTVAHVPEVENEKRPDLLATSDGTRMFVEVKARVHDATLQAEMEAVPVGATRAVLTPLEKHNSMSADVKDANDQLGAIALAGDYRLLWFRADNDLFVHGAREQIVSTLLGFRVVECARGGHRRQSYCAYAGFADFYRFVEIDGAIIEKDAVLTLVLNQFSRRYAGFACSHLSKSLDRAAIVDVERAAQEGDCYVVDGPVNRRDDEEVLEFLRAKYARDTFFRFAAPSAGTWVTAIDARSKRPPEPS